MAAIVTNNGLANLVAGWVAYASRPRHLQWGTGSGQGVASNAVNSTTNASEARTAGTASQENGSVTGDTYQVTGTITATVAKTVTEVGVFDAAGSGSPPTGGNMDLYGDFAGVALEVADSIEFTVQVAFSDGS